MSILSRISLGLGMAVAACGFASAQSCPTPCPTEACPPRPAVRVTVPDCTVPCLNYQPPATCDTCCPPDPVALKKAEKQAAHAQHEYAEACRKQQAVEKHEAEELAERAQKANQEIEKAHAHFERQRAEDEEALSKAATLRVQAQAQEALIQSEQTEEEVVPVEPQPKAKKQPGHPYSGQQNP